MVVNGIAQHPVLLAIALVGDGSASKVHILLV